MSLVMLTYKYIFYGFYKTLILSATCNSRKCGRGSSGNTVYINQYAYKHLIDILQKAISSMIMSSVSYTGTAPKFQPALIELGRIPKTYG